MTIDLSTASAALRGFEPSEYADTPELAMAWRKRAAEAVAPLIEAAVREQIARDIACIEIGLGSEHFAHGRSTALEDAARMARGEQR